MKNKLDIEKALETFDKEKHASLAVMEEIIEYIESHSKWYVICNGKACVCSACGEEFDNTCNDILNDWKYCPNCGTYKFSS